MERNEGMSERDMGKCDYCDSAAVAELDGDYLCQRHADMWCRAEEEEWRRFNEESEECGDGA